MGRCGRNYESPPAPGRTSVIPMGEILRKSVLPNGIRVVTEGVAHVRSVAVGVWVETGSRHEPEPLRGISHFIEHLVFKGTESRSGPEIARAVDSVGGQMDAFTAKEHTCFYLSVLDEHLPLAVELLIDILLHPRFSPEDMEREKSVIAQEIRMVEDAPDDLIHDLFAERVWPGHPLGRPILGSWEVIQGLRRDEISNYYREEYTPGRITIAVAGHVDHENVVELFHRHLGGFVRPGPARNGTPPKLVPQCEVIGKTLEQVHFCLGLPGLPQAHPARYVLAVLNDIVGGSMSSRLFQEIREQEGLVYSIYSASLAFKDAGLLFVYAGTDEEKFDRVVTLILRELRGIRNQGVTPEEVLRAKEHLKGSLVLSLESTSSRMNRLARQELYHGHFITLDEMLAAIDAVSLREVQDLAQELLDGSQLSLVALGPVRTPPSREALIL